MKCKDGDCETIDKLCVWPFRDQDGDIVIRACIAPQCVRCGQYGFPTRLVKFAHVRTEAT